METDWREQITVDPRVQGGKPVLKGTRMPVYIVVGAVASGMSTREICDEYYLTEEQVRSALRYAAETMADEIVVVS